MYIIKKLHSCPSFLTMMKISFQIKNKIKSEKMRTFESIFVTHESAAFIYPVIWLGYIKGDA